MLAAVNSGVAAPELERMCRGADDFVLNFCDRRGFIPLHRATLRGDLAAIVVLLEHGAVSD